MELVSQEELQHLVVHALSGHVGRASPSPVVQVNVGAVKEEESGCIIATIEGREEESCLALSDE